jgi:hypothetical protein
MSPRENPKRADRGRDFAAHWARVIRRWQTELEIQRALRVTAQSAERGHVRR